MYLLVRFLLCESPTSRVNLLGRSASVVDPMSLCGVAVWLGVSLWLPVTQPEGAIWFWIYVGTFVIVWLVDLPFDVLSSNNCEFFLWYWAFTLWNFRWWEKINTEFTGVSCKSHTIFRSLTAIIRGIVVSIIRFTFRNCKCNVFSFVFFVRHSIYLSHLNHLWVLLTHMDLFFSCGEL